MRNPSTPLNILLLAAVLLRRASCNYDKYGYYNNYAANYGDYDDQPNDEYAHQEEDDDYKQANDDWSENDESGSQDEDNSSGTLDSFSYKGESGFDAVSIMPVSCLNYNNGHMVKFELFENNSNYQCHFKNLGSFVVSVAHYMRAYFNYEFVVNGDNFQVPDDAGYLTCVELDETSNTGNILYGKIGCQEKDSLVSTRLQLYIYTDEQCSVPYGDSSSGSYSINGYTLSNKVSFRPPFYTCSTCTPPTISSSFSKQSKNWYDDDLINGGGENHIADDFYDDGYDDNRDGDGAYKEEEEDDGFWANQGTNINYDYFQSYNDDNRRLDEKSRTREESNRAIVQEGRELRRQLVSRGVGNWNMCDRLWRYGAYCDEDCQELDTFRVDQWSSSDIFLLIVMCLFMASMMLLVIAKRIKAYERASIYGDEGDIPYPGLPPVVMFLIFVVIMTVILVLANLKMVNATLLFAVITCIILFMYMLKLTLFENRGPMLLPAAHRQ
eukprot:CAMPEP_0116071486 /NCGR_PEP_ID=MMETSP0322-20121206/13784_1 /TAXON_ID=163516 /ORGANISM="Leptocylindrus danicus var. apora, Strain B651" /LENGTH=495 /DNA_ID=CAMNT_0003559795 /DNA_START=90 /DNA_END=1574 /DNA_ORIENTATION=-